VKLKMTFNVFITESKLIKEMEMDDENSPEEFYERYFASSAYGEHLYFIEVRDFCGMDSYLFETSLKLNLYDFPKLRKVINVICNKETSKNVRGLMVEILFRSIKEQIPGVEKFYFKKCELNKLGHYSESWSKTYESVIENYQPKCFIPFSAYRNEIIFTALKKAYEEEKQINDTRVEVEKELFESNLINDELKFGYIEIYETDAKYYFQEGWGDVEVLEFYYMIGKGEKLIFWFLINIK
jgi:hypothetical protein